MLNLIRRPLTCAARRVFLTFQLQYQKDAPSGPLYMMHPSMPAVQLYMTFGGICLCCPRPYPQHSPTPEEATCQLRLHQLLAGQRYPELPPLQYIGSGSFEACFTCPDYTPGNPEPGTMANVS